jgi:PadR family transcriptional regulator, regulatory protein PadR
MKGDNIGEFEELVLLMVASIAIDAYGVAVRAELETQAKRSVNISAVHAALYRLEDKGYLKSELGGATDKRGGKMKRYFSVTQAGFTILRDARKIREQLWRTIPQLSLKGK